MQRIEASGLAGGASQLDAALRFPSAARVLFAYEDSHLVYRDALVRVIRALRPHVAVTTVGLPSLEAEVERLGPHLVVSSRSNTVGAGIRAAWYRLSHGPSEPSEVCLGGRRSKPENPGVEERGGARGVRWPG